MSCTSTRYVILLSADNFFVTGVCCTIHQPMALPNQTKFRSIIRDLWESPNNFILSWLSYDWCLFVFQVICKNKREGKQQAAQAILQMMHPHIRTWGSLLRLYAKASEIKDKRVRWLIIHQVHRCHNLFSLRITCHDYVVMLTVKPKLCSTPGVMRTTINMWTAG